MKGRFIWFALWFFFFPKLNYSVEKSTAIERNKLHGHGDQHDHFGFETQFLCAGN